MPVLKRPCANCPFRNDGKAIELRPGRVDGIVQGLLEDDMTPFPCHKTLDAARKTCAGSLAVLDKLGRLPVIGRIALMAGIIDSADLEASKAMVIDPSVLNLKPVRLRRPKRPKGSIKEGLEVL